MVEGAEVLRAAGLAKIGNHWAQLRVLVFLYRCDSRDRLWDSAQAVPCRLLEATGAAEKTGVEWSRKGRNQLGNLAMQLDKSQGTCLSQAAKHLAQKPSPTMAELLHLLDDAAKLP